MYCTIRSIASSRRKLQASVAPPSSSTPWTSRLPSAATSAIGETPPDRSASSTIDLGARGLPGANARLRGPLGGGDQRGRAVVEDRRGRIGPTARVHDDPGRLPRLGKLRRAHGELRIVGQHGAGAHHDRIRPRPQAMGVGARLRGRDPAGGAVMRGRLAVERGGHLPDDEGQPGADVALEGAVSPLGLLGEDAFDDLDAGGSQTGDASAVHERVRIGGGDDDARDAGGDQGVGARGCRRVMVAGLQGGVHRRAAGSVPRLARARGPRRAVRRAGPRTSRARS